MLDAGDIGTKMVDKIPAFRELTKKQTMMHVSHTFSLMKGEDGLPWKMVLYRPYPDYSVGWRIRKDHAEACGRDAK